MDLPLREHDTQNQFGLEVHRQEVHHGVAEDGLLTGPGARCSLRALALLELFPTFSSCSRSSRFVSEFSSQDSGSFSLENTLWELLGTAGLEPNVNNAYACYMFSGDCFLVSIEHEQKTLPSSLMENHGRPWQHNRKELLCQSLK